MSDPEIYEHFKAQRKGRQSAATQRRSNAPAVLAQAGVGFSSHNGGAHLIVTGTQGFIDFWPGTEKWQDRETGQKGFGLNALLKHINGGAA